MEVKFYFCHFSLQLIWRIESKTLLQSQPSMASRSLEYLSNATGTGPSRLTWLIETGLLVFVGYILAYYIPQVSYEHIASIYNTSCFFIVGTITLPIEVEPNCCERKEA